jgi:hypothetical protein
LHHPIPFRQLEQIAGRGLVAPEIEVLLAGRIDLYRVETGQPAVHPQDRIAGDAFGGEQRQDGIRIRIMAERGRERDIGPGPRHVDRGIEGVAPAGAGEAAIAAAQQLNHDLADTDGAGLRIAHGVSRAVPIGAAPVGARRSTAA